MTMCIQGKTGNKCRYLNLRNGKPNPIIQSPIMDTHGALARTLASRTGARARTRDAHPPASPLNPLYFAFALSGWDFILSKNEKGGGVSPAARDASQMYISLAPYRTTN